MKIEKTDYSPYVNLSIDEPIFEIKGNAYSDDASNSFLKVMDWMDNNFPNLEKDLECEFEIYVINDLAYRNFINIFEKLQEFVSKGKKIRIFWYCDPEDEDMFELAEDIGYNYGIPVEIRLKRLN